MNAPTDLRLQVWLYILFISSLLAGSLGLAGHAWPQLPVPESLMVTAGGAVALILSGAVMLSLMMQRRHLQRLLGGLLLAVAIYGFLHDPLAGPSDFDLTFPSGQARLGVYPAMATALLAAVALLGIRDRRGRLLGSLVGGFGVLVGGYVLVLHLCQADAVADRVHGFSRVSSLFCLGFGASLLLLSRSTKRTTFTIDSSAAILGALSVLSTFVLLVLASWGTQVDRVSSAKATADHHAVMLEREIRSSVGLIGRLAERWAVLDLSVPAALMETDLRRYFDDIPALVSMAAFRESGELIVSAGKTASHGQWLAHQLVDRADGETVGRSGSRAQADSRLVVARLGAPSARHAACLAERAFERAVSCGVRFRTDAGTGLPRRYPRFHGFGDARGWVGR